MPRQRFGWIDAIAALLLVFGSFALSRCDVLKPPEPGRTFGASR